MICPCKNQLVPHDPLPGACTDEPADMECHTVEEHDRGLYRVRPGRTYSNDPVVRAYDELDLRLMADMEGGH